MVAGAEGTGVRRRFKLCVIVGLDPTIQYAVKLIGVRSG